MKRLNICIFLIFIIIFLVTIECISGTPNYELLPKVEIRKIPDWVIEHAISPQKDIPVSEIVDGEYFLHVDKQLMVDNDAETCSFQRYAILVVNETGMSRASQAEITFDPSYQQLLLHYVNIKRGNQIIDKTKDIQIELLRREKRLESLVYDGRYSANIIINDIRIGDIVEYAFTKIGENPIYQNYFAYDLYLNWQVPADRLSFRLIWPENRPLFFMPHQTDTKLDIEQNGPYKIYSLDLQKIKKVNYESNTPAWFSPYEMIQLSEFNNWKSVVAWALPLYEPGYKKYTGIETIAKKIINDHNTDKERFLAALNFIQKKIRYLGIEMGVNSHKPSTPDKTLSRRYGDCKDKAMAFICLLKAMDIEAKPALVNTSLSYKIKDRQPSIHAFDHVIVKANIANETVWVDPTRIYQGNDFSRLYQPYYGYALVIDPAIDGLSQMPVNRRFSNFDIFETISLIDKTDFSADYKIKTIYQGVDAEKIRYRLAEEGRQNVADGFFEFYSRYYPKIEKNHEISIVDDKNKNKVTIDEKYTLNNFWKAKESEKKREAYIYSNGVDSYLQKPKQIQRTQPLAISHPVKVTQTIHLLFPEPYDIEPFDFENDNAFFRFSANVSYNPTDKSADLIYTYESKTDHVMPDDQDLYIEMINRSNKQLDYELYKDDSASSPTWISKLIEQYDLIYIGIIVVFLFLGGYATIEWWLEYRRKDVIPDGEYFPVSQAKFCILSLATFGIYVIYWFFKQWRFIKAKENLLIMPFWRAIFTPVWFFSLYHYLKIDSQVKFGRNRLPSIFWVVLLFIGYMVCHLSERFDNAFIYLSHFSFVFILPFLNYINYINQENKDLYRFNSRFKPRHFILGLFALLLFSYSISVDLNIIPNGEVIEGKQVPKWNIKRMQKKGLLLSNESLIYFYSDSMLSYTSDGNGITDKEVFSYWKDDSTGKLEIQRARYENIEDIEIDYGCSDDDITIITIKPKNQSSFVMYMATDNNMDKKAVSEIQKRLST